MKSQVVLPTPPGQYSQNDQAQMRRAIADEDLKNVKVTDYATTLVRGIVKVDGTTITVAADGTISGSAAAYTEGTWTPTDASGASLSLSIVRAVWRRIGNLVFVQVILSYPATANGSVAVIGGWPVTFPTNGQSMFAALSGTANGTAYLMGLSATKTAQLFKTTGTVTNANMTGSSLVFSGFYPAT